MGWLAAASVMMTILAGISFGLASLVLFRRTRAIRFGWTGKILLLLLLVAAALHLLAGIDPTILPPAGWTLSASLSLLAVAAAIWPFLRHLTAQLSLVTDDIVKRRLEVAESNAIESRRWLELAEKIAHVGHWRFTIADRKMVWSEEIYQIYGVAKDRFTLNLETALAAYVPEDRKLVASIFESALTNPGPFECSARLLRADGSLRHVQSRGLAQSDENGAVIAIFGVFADVTDQKKIEQELKEAHALSEYSNRALQEMAMQDALTGLPNRRHFDSALAQEFKRAARDNAELSLIMIDLDHFKSYNDCYGHPAGDECLRRVAEAIASVPQRPADLVARYGGEELVMLLPNTTANGAATVARLAGEAVRQRRIPHSRNPEKIVTVSCGVASFAPGQDPQVAIMLVERADQALYRAKLAGRNRVTTYADVAGRG
jgi:diguanylate cyclase (GGDEF)-like protein/PAS domain S-box-containing protein